MNAWGLPAGALPEELLPPCRHGHEVAVLRRRADGTFITRCESCGGAGEDVPAALLLARGWRLEDIEPETAP